MFSGLVALPNTSSPRVGELFYTLYTAQNSNASDSPLILWFNGGPGTSCSLGALYELGYVLVTARRSYSYIDHIG